MSFPRQVWALKDGWRVRHFEAGVELSGTRCAVTIACFDVGLEVFGKSIVLEFVDAVRVVAQRPELTTLDVEFGVLFENAESSEARDSFESLSEYYPDHVDLKGYYMDLRDSGSISIIASAVTIGEWK